MYMLPLKLQLEDEAVQLLMLLHLLHTLLLNSLFRDHEDAPAKILFQKRFELPLKSQLLTKRLNQSQLTGVAFLFSGIKIPEASWEFNQFSYPLILVSYESSRSGNPSDIISS